MRVCIIYDCLYPYTVGGGERWYRNVAERVGGSGHEVTASGHQLFVSLQNEATYDAIRDAAADLGLPLARVELERHNLGDLFRDVPAPSKIVNA